MKLRFPKKKATRLLKERAPGLVNWVETRRREQSLKLGGWAARAVSPTLLQGLDGGTAVVLAVRRMVILGCVPRAGRQTPVRLICAKTGAVVAQAATYSRNPPDWFPAGVSRFVPFEIWIPPGVWETQNRFPLELEVRHGTELTRAGELSVAQEDFEGWLDEIVHERRDLSITQVLRHVAALPDEQELSPELMRQVFDKARSLKVAGALPNSRRPKNLDEVRRAAASEGVQRRPVFELTSEFNQRVVDYEGREHELFRELVKSGRLSFEQEGRALTSVIPYFCEIDRIEELIRATRRPTVMALGLVRGSWGASYSAAVFGARGKTERLCSALKRLQGAREFSAPAVGFGVRKFVAGAASSDQKSKVARLFLRLFEEVTEDYWGNANDLELMRALVAILCHAQPSDSAEFERFAVKLCGTSPHFWRLARQELSSGMSSFLQEAERRFWRLEDALAAQSWGEAADDTTFFADAGCPEASRLLLSLAQAGCLDKSTSAEEEERLVNLALECTEGQEARFAVLPIEAPRPASLGVLCATYDLPAESSSPPSAAPWVILVHTTHARIDAWRDELERAWVGAARERGLQVLYCMGGEPDGGSNDVLTVADAVDQGLTLARLFAASRWVNKNAKEARVFHVPDATYVDVERLLASGVGLAGEAVGLPLGRSGAASAADSLDPLRSFNHAADLRFGVVLSAHTHRALAEQSENVSLRRVVGLTSSPSRALGHCLAEAGLGLSSAGYFCHQIASDSGGTLRASGYRSYVPGKSSPTLVVALDEPKLLSELADERSQSTTPRRLWPAYETPTVGHNKNQIDLISPPERLQCLDGAEPVVVAVMYNEQLLASHFLDHYRKLGVKAFVICDNASSDGTREYLLQQEDVVLYTTDSSYRDSRYGTIWQQAILDAHCLGRWALVVDADEFLVFPGSEERPLREFTQELESQGYDSSWQALVDMYPYGDLTSADFTEAAPADLCRFCDRDSLLPWRLSRGRFSTNYTYLSSLRHRLIPGSPPHAFTSQKHALFRYRPWIRIGMGIHCTANLNPAPDGTAFAHFKYHAGFKSKVDEGVARNEHFRGAQEYRDYQALLAETKGNFGIEGVSVDWRSSRDFLRPFEGAPQLVPRPSGKARRNGGSSR